MGESQRAYRGLIGGLSLLFNRVQRITFKVQQLTIKTMSYPEKHKHPQETGGKGEVIKEPQNGCCKENSKVRRYR